MSDQAEKNKISSVVLEKIVKENLQMRTFLYFLIISWTWRLLAVLVLLFSSVIFSIAVYEIVDMELISEWQSKPIKIIENFPFMLILFGSTGVYLSSRLYRRSRICCRHEEWALLVALGLISTAIVIFFYFNNIAFYFYESINHIEKLKFFVI